MILEKECISKVHFMRYMKVRKSGVINMLDVRAGCKLTGLMPSVYKSIIVNFKYLYEKYGKHSR